MTDLLTNQYVTSVRKHSNAVNHSVYPQRVARRNSLRQSAVDTPLARWLVDYAEARGWTSGRQAALSLRDAAGAGINPAVFGTWLRGEFEPDTANQQHLAEATGVPLAAIAELVRRTKSQLQRLSVGDLRRMRAEEDAAPTEPSVSERLERIERQMLTEARLRGILEDYFRRQAAGDQPDYIDDPDPSRPPAAFPEEDAEDFREAVG